MTSWDEITQAIGIALSGERERGKELLQNCWSATGQEDHAQRCVIAHYLADTHDDLGHEVDWDERALSEHTHVNDQDLAPIGIPTARGLAPSLHLNLGDGYLRQGHLEHAQKQLAAGLAHTDALSDDGYGAMIRKGLTGLQERIQAASTA